MIAHYQHIVDVKLAEAAFSRDPENLASVPEKTALSPIYAKDHLLNLLNCCLYYIHSITSIRFCTIFNLSTVTSFSLPTNIDEEISAYRIHQHVLFWKQECVGQVSDGPFFKLNNWLDT